jgi:TonB-linked SusC/RagA family outer membrane protein
MKKMASLIVVPTVPASPPSRGRRFINQILLVRTQSLVFFLVLLLLTGSRLVAQTVTITAKQTPLKMVLNMTEEQTGYFVFYSSKDLRKTVTDMRVSFVVKDMPLKNFLDMIFKDKPVSYKIEDKNIALIPRGTDGRDSAAQQDHPAKIMIQGQVMDKDGNPVKEVTVTVKGTATVAIGDEGGNYRVAVPSRRGITLIFSSVGCEPKEIPVENENEIKVIMVRSNAKLNEVVVVAYGTNKTALLTGAISTVKSKELNENHSSTAVSDMLAGRLPGLFVQKMDGTVGMGSDIKIRGLSTFNNSSPLIVVDGIPGRTLNDLNPTDIESISVLKDAAASAVYGARSANGVILVTTKKGKAGPPEITFSSTLIDQTPTFLYKREGSYQYALLQNEAYTNEGTFNPLQGKGYTQAQLDLYKNGKDPNRYPNTDWVKAITKPHVIQSAYNLSASGGNESIKYFVSAGYVHTSGLAPVEDYKRWNFRSNLEGKIGDHLKMNLNLGGVFATTSGEASQGLNSVILDAYQTPPTRVNQFSNGYYASGSPTPPAKGLNGFNTTNNNTLNSTLSLEWQLPWVKGLSVEGTAAYDKGYTFSKAFVKPYQQYQIDSIGRFTLVPSNPTTYNGLTETFSQLVSLTTEGALRYTTKIGVNHFSGLVLYTQTKITTDNLGAQRRQFVSYALPQMNLGNPALSTNSGDATLSTRQGVVGRISYDFDEKYLLELNGRYDGSDIFPPNHRFGFFPSVSVGWVLSKESFYNIPNLDFVKIRGSWGQLGNDQVPPYQFLSTYSLRGGEGDFAQRGYGYTFGGANPIFFQSLQPGTLPNPSFAWERAVTTDVGLEAHYKDNLVTLELDYFRKRTKDILVQRNLQTPSVIGGVIPNFNDGIVDNSGFEIDLGHHHHIGQVTYYVDGNISFNSSKIVSYPESLSTPPWQKITGLSVGSFLNQSFNIGSSGPWLGYHADGLYQSADEVNRGPKPLYPNVGPGDIRYVDIDKSGTITDKDMVVLGDKFFPKIQYGIRFGAAFKGIECNVLLQGTAAAQGYNAPANQNAVPSASWKLDRWTPTNHGASYPRLWVDYQNNSQSSDYWVVNSAYMRVKNIEVAYTLPKQLLGKAFKSVRITLSGNNLITFSKFKWYDPEAMNINNTTASTPSLSNPLLKSFTAGLSVQF